MPTPPFPKPSALTTIKALSVVAATGLALLRVPAAAGDKSVEWPPNALAESSVKQEADAELEHLAKYRLNELRLVKAHNSYDKQAWAGLTHALNHTNVIEIDLSTKSNRNGWWVSHGYARNDNNCHGPDGGHDGSFAECLADLAAWSHERPGHPVVIVNIDFKSGWKGTQRRFDELLESALGPQLYRPKQLRGSRADLRSAVRQHGWPVMGTLSDQFVIVLTGGPAGFRNQHLRHYVQRRYLEDDYAAAAFVCPDADDPDDVLYPQGDWDAINREKQHVACANHDRKHIDSLATTSAAWRELLVLGYHYGTDAASTALAARRGVGILARDVSDLNRCGEDQLGLRFQYDDPVCKPL